MVRKFLSAFAGCLAVLSLCSFASAQTTEEAKISESPQAIQVALDENGKLVGNVFTEKDGEKKPIEARITLTNEQGVVVDTVTADANGLFAFPSLEPGSYMMYGTSGSFFGSQPIAVQPVAAAAQCSSCNLGLSSGVSYDSYASAPAASFGGGGCGCSGGGGGLLRGRLGSGGGIGGSRLLRLGLIGGVVAIAVSGDDDATPIGP